VASWLKYNLVGRVSATPVAQKLKKKHYSAITAIP